MTSTRMLITSISAVFISLGIGIILGGTGGQTWVQQQEQEWLHQLETRFEQAAKEKGQLKRVLQQQENRLQGLKKQNQSLLKEAVRERLRGRHILLVGGDDRLAHKLGRAIRLAGGTVSRPASYPMLPDRYDAIVFLMDPDSNHRRTIRDVRLTFSGPLILQGTESSRAVFGSSEERSYSFPGSFTGDPLQTCELIQLIQNATHRGNEASS